MTHPKIIAKKERMCRRFGHIMGHRFKTVLGMAFYCTRCGGCYAPRGLTTEGKD